MVKMGEIQKKLGEHPERNLGRCYPNKSQVAPYKNLGRFYRVPFKSLLRVQIKWVSNKFQMLISINIIPNY